jgi:Na+/proline symporter
MAPAGYQPYPGAPEQQGASGLAIASLVLSLVGVIPCFWVLQVPGLLGMIFGFIGLGQTKDGRRGRGMAIAGIVVGVLLVLLCAAIWIAIAADPDHCLEFGNSNMCRD